MEHKLTHGKIRHLRSATLPNGGFAVLAVDHRDSLLDELRAASPDVDDSVLVQQMMQVKLAVTRMMSPYASAILLDPAYGIQPVIETGALPGQVGLLSSLEVEAYSGSSYARTTELLDDWSVQQAKLVGADGVKTLLYYHPHHTEVAQQQEALLAHVVEEARKADIPYYAEPILYPIEETDAAAFAAQRTELLIESMKRFAAAGADVLKIQFPVDADFESNRAVWREACEAVNEAVSIPWVLLSGGTSFEVFQEQVEVACKAGCSGVVVGRAVWRGVSISDGKVDTRFLEEIGKERFHSLSDIVTEHAQGWHERYGYPPG